MSAITVRGSRKSHQSLERSAGTPEPADPAAHYRIEPGETAPEYFPAGLRGLCDAMARAGWLSVAHGPQQVLATRPEGGKLPPCTDQRIREYAAGLETWSAAGASVVQAARPEPESSRPVRKPARQTSGRPDSSGVVLALRGM